MRKIRFDHLLAGTVLAFATATPSFAQQDRIRQVLPMPPTLNGTRVIQRQPEPMPEPVPVSRRALEPVAQEATPLPREAVRQEPVRQDVIRHQPAQIEPLATAPIPQAPAAEDSSFLMSTLDKMLGASDAQIAEKLRGMMSVKSAERNADSERKALETFYASRNYAPLWIRDGRLTANAKTTILRMKNAAADGLDAADYSVPEFGTISGADALAAGEVKFTQSVMTFARHLAVGRIAPTRVTVEVDYGKNNTPEPGDILKRMADARDANAALNSFEPTHDGYRALKAKLAEMRGRGARADANERIAAGRAFKPGEKDARVPQLRDRLNVPFTPPGPRTVQVRDKRTGQLKLVKVPAEDSQAAELVYDRALFNAIKNVQARADIKPTGVINNRTIAAINGPTQQQQIDRVIANIERWRWLPRDLGRAYVMVNVPDYTLKVVRDDSVIWRTRIIAGKPQTPTPLLSAMMDNVIINPSWYVPQSIIQNELLPQYASDPNIFTRMGLEVKRGPDGHINVVQPPGAANALGRIKFNFPNKYQVYLHDTPEKRLFAAERRAFSHGCMRVENPTKFGEIVLGMALAGPAPNQPQIDRLIGQEEKIFKLANQPRVHLTYQTAFVDDAGKLQMRDDIYGFDARIRTILQSDERRVADVAPPQDPKRDLETLRSNQEILRRVERREAANPFVFFEKLFR